MSFIVHVMLPLGLQFKDKALGQSTQTFPSFRLDSLASRRALGQSLTLSERHFTTL